MFYLQPNSLSIFIIVESQVLIVLFCIFFLLIFSLSITWSNTSFNDNSSYFEYCLALMASTTCDLRFVPKTTSICSIGLRLNTTTYGTQSMAELMLQFRAKISSGNIWRHCFWFNLRCSSIARSVSLTLRMFRSANPFPCEWYADDRRFFMPILLHNSCIASPSTLDPWSLRRNWGVPWI